METYNERLICKIFSLAKLTDKFGGRMAGSTNLENAIDYTVDRMKRAGLDNVHTENATVPHWQRGLESCTLLTPRKQTLAIAGLGTSVGTPPGGIIANIIAVESFDEFEKLSADVVRGKIVVFVPQYESYGLTGRYRYTASSVASRKGAAAVLVRSIAPFSIGSPHTGSQAYEADVRQIPAAALSLEHADFLLRLYRSGEPVTIKLEMHDRNLGPFVSRNTIAELAGQTDGPVVVLSGHLDSWDLGTGAMDDGGGSFISWKALELIKLLQLKKPKRTIRAILWTGEELGTHGSLAYEQQHKTNEEKEFNLFVESDTGTFEPLGFSFTGSDEARCIFKEVVKLMAPLNATQFQTPASGTPDINRWIKRGFPGAGLSTKNDKFVLHSTYNLRADAFNSIIMKHNQSPYIDFD